MIQVVFLREQDALWGFIAQGHAGYAESGSDIVCAAVSAILLTVCEGLERVVRVRANLAREDARGYLRLTLPTQLTDTQYHDARVALAIAESGIRSIASQYPDHVRLMYRKWRSST